MPPARPALASQPVQLSFDRLAVGFDHQFSADPARVIGRPPRLNPLVIHGVQGTDGSLLLEAMAAECIRLEPEAKVLLADGAALRHALADGRLPARGGPNLLLLHDIHNLPARLHRALRQQLHSRMEEGLLTVLTLHLAPGQDLYRFYATPCTWGLYLQLLPPGMGARRELCLGILRVRGARVDQTTATTMTSISWQCTADVRALGERVLHAAYSSGMPLAPEDVAALGTHLGRQPSQATASELKRCCPSRLHLAPSRGVWHPIPDEPAATIVTAEFHHRCATVELRQRIWPHRFRLDLRADHDGRVPARFELDIVVRPRLTVRVRDAGAWISRPWALTAGLTHAPNDPFTEARDWLYLALTPPRSRGGRPRRTSARKLSQTMREARARIHEAACSVVAMLDANARKIALRFPCHMRRWLYGQLAADRSGRLAQVAQACPGALTFAYGLRAFAWRPGSHRAGERLLSGVIAGHPLNPLLDEAITTWAASAQRKLANLHTTEGQRRVWRCLAESEGSERELLLRAQRLLIRRAGAGVPSMTLWSPPPPYFAPEDIPERKLDNARWYRVMKCLRPLLAAREPLRPEQAHDLCMFVSQHALQVRKCTALGKSDYGRASSILDYARAMDDWPRRGTSPARYLPGAEDWHDRFENMRQMAELAAATKEKLIDEHGNALPFPDPPCPGWCSDKDSVIPLRTAQELLDEGNRMHNCVASRAGEALAGRAFLYHGQVGGRSLTIQIAQGSDGYRLVEAAGTANAKLTAGQKRVIGEFVRHLGKAGACGCEIEVPCPHDLAS